MNLRIHATFLPHEDAETSMAFFRDVLGFEVRNDVGYDGMRWITVGPPNQPDTSIVLHPPAADPGITPEDLTVVREMMAKGTFASLVLAASDLDEVFERLQRHDADIVQEPIDQDYGVRDCAVRDPAGNMIRIQERD
ncbi:glyoxalase [Aeromicrobium sp. PE09-221]|uniref:VOC family protein n=1 Tax=Aeromicrobium sp. PE09-221 TaxID=1898043 RepID=UPI000B3EAE01|nr:VOC family protein [Aeromicrobium sp. PE09-221]OUZ08262.1 glyoxalase [Aeromicrobium sp. PE09-221]